MPYRARKVDIASSSSSRVLWSRADPGSSSTICDHVVQVSHPPRSKSSIRSRGFAACTRYNISASFPSCATSGLTLLTDFRLHLDLKSTWRRIGGITSRWQDSAGVLVVLCKDTQKLWGYSLGYGVKLVRFSLKTTDSLLMLARSHEFQLIPTH